MTKQALPPAWDEACWRVIQQQSDYVEFDWFARDLQGNIGAFASFGTAPSPVAVRTSRTHFNDLLRHIFDLPETTKALLDPMQSGSLDDWEEYARKGLFAYDNAHINLDDPRYVRIASPAKPLLFAELALPERLWNLLPALPIVFAESPSVPFNSVPTLGRLPLERLEFEVMASGARSLRLTSAITWNDFAHYAAGIVAVLGGSVIERTDSAAERVWAVLISEQRFWLSFDDFGLGVSLDPQNAEASALISGIREQLLAHRSQTLP